MDYSVANLILSGLNYKNQKHVTQKSRFIKANVPHIQQPKKGQKELKENIKISRIHYEIIKLELDITKIANPS